MLSFYNTDTRLILKQSVCSGFGPDEDDFFRVIFRIF